MSSRVLLFLVVAWLAGCASLPERGPVVPQTAITDVAGTRLAQVAAAARTPQQQALSGFRLLPEAETSFDARIALAQRAQKSLDVQYYLLANDRVGRLFLRTLRDAAARGVRVRLLVDDLYTGGEDELLAGLAAHENVQVRLFNPLPARGGSPGSRLLRSLPEFDRVNHRMHNKLFIADNSFAVSGGRNIADEYFMRSAEANFIDLDVMSSGPVVRELSAVFDGYWNSDVVYPLQRVLGPTTDPAAARAAFDDAVRNAPEALPERAADVLGHTPVAQQLDEGVLQQVLATAEVFADLPSKVGDPGSKTVTDRTLALFARARREVAISSPYFIPQERGMAMMRAVGATQENGRLTLITNSLGATDEPLAYAGYAQWRLQMLQAGVRIFEISPTLARRGRRLGDFGASFGRLHAKTAIIDHRWMFIGSMNLDPRSHYLNTELGLAIDSPELANTMQSLSMGSLLRGAYRLRLAPDGEHILWVETGEDGREIVHDEEPGASAWGRVKLFLQGLFISTDLL